MAKRKAVVTKAQIDAILANSTPRQSGKSRRKVEAARMRGSAGARTFDPKVVGRAARADIYKGPNVVPTAASVGRKPKDPKTNEYLATTRKADAQSAAMGKPREKKKAWYEHILDNISRTSYGANEAIRRAGTLEDDKFWDFKAGAQGFADGFMLRKRTTGSDILKEHKNLKGPARAVVGFGLDVALDPLTYAGVGLVTKAATKSKSAVEALNEAAALEKELVRKGASKSQVRDVTNAAAVPANAVKRRHKKLLTPEGKELYKFALDEKGAGLNGYAERVVSKYKRKVTNASHVDLRDFPDADLAKVATATVRAEEAAYPGVTSILRRVRSTRTTRKALDGKSQSPADSYASYERFRDGHIDGTIRMHPDKVGNRSYMSDYKNSGGHISVKVDTPEAAIKYMTVHEIGHQVAQAMSDDVKDAIFARIKAKYGDDLSKHISEYGNENFEELTAEAWAEFRLMGKKARPLAKDLAEEMASHMPKAPSKKETQEILDELADDYIEADIKNINEWAEQTVLRKAGVDPTDFQAVNDFYYTNPNGYDDVERLANATKAERGIDNPAAAKAAMRERLLAQTARNLSPTIKKEFQLKLGPTAIGIPKMAEGAAKIGKAVASLPAIKQSVDLFNKGFRASAHIPRGLNHLRATTQGSNNALITDHIKVLQSIFDKVPRASRVSVMRALRDGAYSGNAIKGGPDIDGVPVDDLVAYTKSELEALDLTRQREGLSIAEINDFLHKNHAISFQTKRSGTTTIPDGLDANGNPKYKNVAMTDESVGSDAIFQAILNNPKITDPAQAIYLYSAAINQAIAKRKLWESIAQTHGVPKGDLAQELVTKHGWVESPIKKGASDFIFPPEIAEGMVKLHEVFRDSRSTGEFMQYYDRGLQTFKSVVTRYNPSFHTRTFLGEMLLGYMGGMKNLPRSYKKAGAVIKGRNQQFLGDPLSGEFGDTVSKRHTQASNNLREARATQPGIADGSRVILRSKKYGPLTADKIWHLYLESGLKSGFAATDLVRGTEAPIGGKLVSARNMMQSLTEGVEDYGRLAHFIDVLEHTKAKSLEDAVEEAAMTVRKFHLDYTNVTGFEKSVMTRVMPFYKWIRLSTPLMAEILLTKPGKALAVPKAMRAMAEMAGYEMDNFGAFPGADEVIPEWMREAGAVPVGMFGTENINYLNPTALFPLAGSADLAGGGIKQTFTPAFKVAADLYQGKDNFGNQLIGDAANNKDRLNYALAQTPQTNFANQMITKKDPGIPRAQSLLQFLANPGIQPNTEKRMRGEAFRQRQEAIAHRKKAKKETGVLP